MRSNPTRLIVGGAIVLGLFLLWLMVGFGLGVNLLIRGRISSLRGEAKQNAASEFYAEGKSDNVFAGTIAKVSRKDGGGVWVWSNRGLKYFQADEHTVYSYYDICAAITSSQEEVEMKIGDDNREVSTNIGRWEEQARQGDFVQIIVATPEHGGQIDNLREARVYSLPIFLELNIELLCTN